MEEQRITYFDERPYVVKEISAFVAWAFFVVIVSGACTTRHVYERPATVAAVSVDAININTASMEELERLPRIGPKTAAAIIRFREDNGPFQRTEELMQLHGFSERRFLELRPYLRTE